MKQVRKWVCAALLGAMALLPLPGCRGGPQAIGSLMQLALGVGASVGSYYLIKQLD